MRDVLDDLLAVWRTGGTAGLSTVVRTMRSAPRPPGAAMVVAPDGSVAGSVSGGCVESAVYEVARDVVASGRPDLQRYGVSDDDAFSVGLTCGGTIDIFTEHGGPSGAWERLGAQCFWIAVTWVAGALLTRLGRHRLEVQGG